jgi:hypothetical protein
MDPIKKVLTNYVPKNMEECLEWLDKFIDSKDKKGILNMSEREFIGRSHHGLGADFT